MPLALDASTPAFVTGGADPWVSASFTPPVGSLLVVCVPADWFGSATVTITVTSTGLTFVSQTKQGAENQGLAQIFTAEVGAAGGTARTVSVTTSLGANADSGGVKVYVFTGQHATSYVDAVAGGSNVTTNNFTGNITTGFDGCWVVGCASDWQNLGAATSTDTYENGTPGGIAPIVVRKAAATAIAGVVGLNFDAFGTGTPLWTWAAISIRPAAGGGNSTSVTPATETDTAEAVGRTQLVAVTPATETDNAQTVGRTTIRAVEAAAETDTGQPVGRTRITAASPAIEIDTAQPISAGNQTAVTPAAELDEAQPVGRTTIRAAGAALEVDTALQVGRQRITAAEAATETDVGVEVGRTRFTPVLPALEVDTAGAVTGPMLDLALSGVVEPGRFLVEVEPRWDADRASQDRPHRRDGGLVGAAGEGRDRHREVWTVPGGGRMRRARVFAEQYPHGTAWVYEVVDLSRPEGQRMVISGIRVSWRSALSAAYEWLRVT